MICYMDGKTFLKDFIKRNDPKIILETQYVIVSSGIRRMQKWRNVLSGSVLFPSTNLIVDFDDYNSKAYTESYIDQLDDNKEFLAIIVKYAIEEDMNIVFLRSENENRYRYFEILQDYVDDVFEFHICDYRGLQKGDDAEHIYDHNSVMEVCESVLNNASHENISKSLSSEASVQKLIETIGKKEVKKFLKKELKKRNLYLEDMSMSEMIETYNVFR